MHKASARPLKPEGFYDKAVIAQGLHLLPFRTEKLNLVTSMVLPTRESRTPPPYIGEGPIGNRKPFLQRNRKAVIAQGLHLLPFRTEKLNLVTPMVLPTRESRKRPPSKRFEAISDLFFTGCSAVRLAHLLWEQGVPGSNPGTPTNRFFGKILVWLRSSTE